MIDFQTEILSSLKLVASIKCGEKLNSRDISKQPDNIITSFRRTFIDHDNRHNTQIMIENLVQRSIRFLKNDQADDSIKQHIYDNLIMIIPGINNLQLTYERDDKFKIALGSIVEIMELELRVICLNNPSLYSSYDIRKDQLLMGNNFEHIT